METASSINLFSGDLSPLYQPLLDVVCTNKDDLDDDERLVTHECGHWVIKRLVEIDHIREQTEGGGIGGVTTPTLPYQPLIHPFLSF